MVSANSELPRLYSNHSGIETVLFTVDPDLSAWVIDSSLHTKPDGAAGRVLLKKPNKASVITLVRFSPSEISRFSRQLFS